MRFSSHIYTIELIKSYGSTMLVKERRWSRYVSGAEGCACLYVYPPTSQHLSCTRAGNLCTTCHVHYSTSLNYTCCCLKLPPKIRPSEMCLLNEITHQWVKETNIRLNTKKKKHSLVMFHSLTLNNFPYVAD